MIKSKGYFTIYLLTSIFRLPKGHGISVDSYSEFNTGISFKMDFPDSYESSRRIEFFIPWHNVDYIERHD